MFPSDGNGGRQVFSKTQIGRGGEDRAAEFLCKEGYSVIERNYRKRFGEIDIIAEKDDTLVFVEVKVLASLPLEVLAHELDFRKQEKIIKTAKFYLQNHRQYNSRYIRFDVIAIDAPGLDTVHHIVNAFSE